jgi:hypothetical protein
MDSRLMAATIPTSRFSRSVDLDRMSGILIECSGILIGYFRNADRMPSER